MFRFAALLLLLVPVSIATSFGGEISVTGQGLTIADGDTSPRLADCTDFGQLAAGGGTRTHTFVIRNTSSSSGLLVVGVMEDSPAFSLIGAPSGVVIGTNGTRSFEVRFNPTSAGVKTATVTIVNDDSNENPYTFEITGEGLGTPDMVVRGRPTPASAWRTISDGQTAASNSDGTLFGDANVDNGLITRTFEIENTGDGQLTLSSFSDTSADFVIANEPSVVGVNQTQTFDVVFNPSVSGTRTSTLTILSNDPDSSPFTFALKGVGLAAEARVTGQGTTINDGDTTPRTSDGTDFGQVAAGGGTVSRTFVIHNDGNTSMTVSSVADDSGAFSISGAPTAAQPIPAGGSDSFTITFDPTSAGVKTATVSITTNDPNASQYTFAITGEGLGTPDMRVRGRLNAASPWVTILDGDPSPTSADGTDFGNANVDGGSVERTFQVGNLGDAQLTMSSTSSNSSHFTISGADSVVGVSQSKTFMVVFDPSARGVLEATITLRSNDPDEDPYTFRVSGTGRGPDLVVTGQGREITNGDLVPRSADGTDFGTVAAGAVGGVSKTFVLNNSGNSDLFVSSVLENGAAFSVSGAPSPATPISPGTSASMTITFDPVSGGTKTATVQIRSNDPFKDPYTFGVVGESLGTPEMVISGRQLPSSPWTEIANGETIAGPDNGTSFGPVEVEGGSTSLDYRLENTGFAKLTISSITSSSPHFVVSAVPSAVPVTSEDAFTVTFDPQADGLGALTGIITVRSNDPNDDPFTFTVIGTAIAPRLVVRGTWSGYRFRSKPAEEEDEDDGPPKPWELPHIAGNAIGCLVKAVNPWNNNNNDCWGQEQGSTIPCDGTIGVSISAGDMTPSAEDHTYLGTQRPKSSSSWPFGFSLGHVSDLDYRTSGFRVVNEGNKTLMLTGIALDNSSSFVIESFGPGIPIPPDHCTYFNVSYGSSSDATDTAVISIVTDDPVTPNFTFAVSGTTVSDAVIRVSGEGDPEEPSSYTDSISNGASALDIGYGAQFDLTGVNGETSRRSFTVQNTGDLPLEVSSIESSDAQFVVESTVTSIPPDGSREFEVVFDPESPVELNATITIESNAHTDSTFSFEVTGKGQVTFTLQPGEPDIVLRGGADWSTISHGELPSVNDGTDYELIPLGGAETHTFRLHNDGVGALTITNAIMVGAPNALSGVASSIPPGGFDDFTITVSPNSSGEQIRPVLIGSNDPDRPIFGFWVTAQSVDVSIDITDHQFSGDDVIIWFTSTPGFTYQVTSNTNMSGTWNLVPSLSGLVGSEAPQSVTVVNGAVSTRRFFQVELE